jgi:hypothetical protein
MLKFAVAPALMESGVVKPVSLNPAPVIVALVMVSVEFPVFFSCTVCELLVPADTDPKPIVDGVAVSPAAAPVPVAVIERFCPCVVTNDTEPLEAPVVVGVNITFSVAVCAGAIVVGVVIPVAV